MLFPVTVEVWLEAFLILHDCQLASRLGRFTSGVRAPLASGYYAGKARKYMWTLWRRTCILSMIESKPEWISYCSIQFHVTCFECHWCSVLHATLPETFVKALNSLQGPTTCFALYGHHHVPVFLVWGNSVLMCSLLVLFLLMCLFFVLVLPYVTVITSNNNSVALVRERNIPTKRPPLVDEVSANFCGYRGDAWAAWRYPTAVISPLYVGILNPSWTAIRHFA
jgi:hypothetical protein